MEQIDRTGHAITIIHFVYEAMVPPGDNEPEGPPSAQWRIACMPNMVELHATFYHPHYPRTNSPQAVTCPQCKKTQIFKDSMHVKA